jgi:hypothetical protein
LNGATASPAVRAASCASGRVIPIWIGPIASPGRTSKLLTEQS